MKEKDLKRIRQDLLKNCRLIVVKVGSAVLTHRDGTIDIRIITRLVDQLSAIHDEGKKIILVSSGAVAVGRAYLHFPSNIQLPLWKKQAAAAVGQSRLMHLYDEAFEKYNKITAQILLTKDDLRNRHRFLNARNTFFSLLEEGAIPIVNENDTVVVEELKFGDNDFLATLILNLVEADLFINLTSAKGVFTSNPDINPSAKKINVISDIGKMDISSMCEGKTNQGSGGMYSKLLAAKRAAQLGVPTLIVSGKIPFVLEKVFSGEDHGTWILPSSHTISRRKFWFAYNLEPQGEIVIDTGAKNALLFKGKSLLPAGIVEVRGNFPAHSLVKIIGEDKTPLGVGISNFGDRELSLIKGKKTFELASILGESEFPEEVIHRDNMLLDAIL